MILRNSPVSIAATLRGLAERPDCTQLLPSIDIPTLVLCGKDDQISPTAEMKAMAQAIPADTIRRSPRLGPHVSHGEPRGRQRNHRSIPENPFEKRREAGSQQPDVKDQQDMESDFASLASHPGLPAPFESLPWENNTRPHF